MAHRGENDSIKLRKDYFCATTVNPTADTLLRLFALHSALTLGDEYTIYSKSRKVDHLHKLLELLGLQSEPGGLRLL